MIGTRQPTIDEAVEIIIRYASTPECARKDIDYWRQKFGDAFADAVRDKARAQWKKHRK